LDKAKQTLIKTGLPPVFGSAAVSAEVRTFKPLEVTWIVSDRGSEIMRYTATLSVAGENKTRIALDLKGAKSDRAGDVEKRFAENKSIRNLYLVAMGEKIASSIEGRPLDMSKVYPALAIAAAANMGNMQKSLDEAVRASEELERDHARNMRRRGG